LLIGTEDGSNKVYWTVNWSLLYSSKFNTFVQAQFTEFVLQVLRQFTDWFYGMKCVLQIHINCDRDHKANDFIRRELKITGILDKIDEYRLNWRLYLQRMPRNRIPLKSYHYRPQGRRTICRPKKRWREQL